ncbi:hypothetical protein quinque_012034 [Culex quinquefasciatus]
MSATGMASLLLPALVCSKLLDVTDLRCGSWRMFPKANESVQCCVQRTRNGFTGGVGALSGNVAAAEAGECDKQRTGRVKNAPVQYCFHRPGQRSA